VADNFGTVAYNNNNGTDNWATNWVETTDDNNAASGTIQINGQRLRIGDNSNNATPLANINREVNLTALGFQQAFLTFDVASSGNLDNPDMVAIEVSGNGGGSWTTLETFTNDITATRTYNITTSIASNTRIRFRVVGGFENNEFFFADNLQINDGSGGALTAGHWELRVDQTNGGVGDDINALGIRASDEAGTPSAAGTELNIYYDAITSYGANVDFTSTYTNYPYVTSGCSASKNDFDWDSDSGNTGSLSLTDRTGAFSQNYASAAMSQDGLPWQRDTFTGWTTDTNALGYGLWTMGVTIASYPANGNYGELYIGRFNVGANPPTANPPANTFRVYLPTDAGAQPLEPYVEQQIRYGGSGGANGPNPPQTGVQSIFTVTVRVVNPGAQAITFSAANLVRANVPGAPVLYGGVAQVSQGAIVAQPAVGGSGNITWNPGTLAAGGTALLAYRVRITPTGAGRIVATGTTALNGTQAVYVDTTGNTTQARATYTFGPLCELAVTPAVLTPVVVSDLRTIKSSDGVTVEWNTASEVGAAGFDLYRWDTGRSRWVKVNQRLVSALVGAPQGGRYRVNDPGGSRTGSQWYLLKETEIAGPGKTYGPFDTSAGDDDGRSLKDGRDERRARKPGLVLLNASKESSARRARKKAADAGAPGRSASAALKIGVEETGLVFVPRETLAAHFGLTPAGASTLIGSGRFNLTNQGGPVAWMAAGERGLLFYGEAIDSPYTRDNVYWLQRGRGYSIDQVSTGPAPATGATAGFRDTTHAEQDLLPATIVATDPNTDYWFWDYLSAGDPVHGKKSFIVNATSLSPGGSPVLRVNLSGATSSGVANEHHVVVRLNGVGVGDDHWTGIAARTLSLPVDAALLHEGGNDVEVEAVLDAGVGFSVFYVDGFDLTYRRAFAAIGSALALRGDGVPGVTVTDFADQGVVVLDISNPKLPRRVKRVRVQGSGGNYRASFAPAQPATNYFAVSEAGWRAPAWTEGDVPSDLKSRSAAADYVIITTDELQASAEALASQHQASGLSTRVVDIQDIYDEFSFGLQDPRAMQSFLGSAARRWSTPPRYVLIAGRGDVDYKNNLGFGGNLVPPLMVSTPKGLFASDTRLGDVSGNDGIPEIAVGRIPVLTSEELDSYASKLQAYEHAPAPDHARHLLLLADQTGGGTDFGAASDQIASSLPEGYDASRIYLQQGLGIAVPREELFTALDAGVDLVNYTGHGAIDRLSSQGLLTSADAPNLTNTQLPVLTALSCTINRFEVQGFAPLGEELVKRPGAGFAAVWAPTGLSQHDEATILGNAFYSGVAAHPGLRLGDAVNQAFQRYKVRGGLAWMPDIYSLLGDPALTLKEGVVVAPDDSGTPKQE